MRLEQFNLEQMAILENFRSENYFEEEAWSAGEITLTQSGRLVADRIVRELVL
jgi:hypothetical protein